MEKDEFDFDDEYNQYRRRQRIHRMHLVGYVIFAALVLIGMLLFWHRPSTRNTAIPARGLPPHLYKCGGKGGRVLV